MTSTIAPKSVGYVVYSIKVNGQQVLDWPYDVQLQQRWGEHDLMTLMLYVPKGRPHKNRLVAWADLAPIEVAWGRQPGDISTWYGYVHHHQVHTEDVNTGDRAMLQIDYVCIGTSQVMDTDRQVTWQNIKPSDIAVRIAKNNRLRSVVTVTEWVIDYEVQASQSDFKFLNKLANKYGFKFWVSGGTLYFIDPSAVLSGASNYFVPHYVINGIPGYRDTARQFKLNEGSSMPGGYQATRSISGIDSSTGKPFTVTNGTGSTSLVHTDLLARSYAEGKQLIDATASLAQYWVGATVQVFGQTILYPGKVVHLSGYLLPDNLPADYIVTGARHHLKQAGVTDPTKDLYITDLEIMTNSKAGTPLIKGVQKISPELCTCILNGKTWQSTSMAVITDGVLTTA